MSVTLAVRLALKEQKAEIPFVHLHGCVLNVSCASGRSLLVPHMPLKLEHLLKPDESRTLCSRGWVVVQQSVLQWYPAFPAALSC